MMASQFWRHVVLVKVPTLTCPDPAHSAVSAAYNRSRPAPYCKKVHNSSTVDYIFGGHRVQVGGKQEQREWDDTTGFDVSHLAVLSGLCVTGRADLWEWSSVGVK